MKRLKVIACKVLFREISLIGCRSESILDVTYLRQGLHDTPEMLNKTLQAEIDRIDSGKDVYSQDLKQGREFDAIVLAYGLCSNAICGLKSSRYPLVVPRAHDCITLFLGSKERYKEYFDTHSGGIYWYTQGWIEHSSMPGRERMEHLRAEYTEKFDEESAEYLLETEAGWMKAYSRCTYVDWESLHSESHIEYTRECARYLDWDFDLLTGESSLLERMLSGDWDSGDFLIAMPGEAIKQSYDDAIIRAEPQV